MLTIIFGGAVAGMGSLLSRCSPPPLSQESSLGIIGITHLGVARDHLNLNRPGGYLSLAFQGSLVPMPAGIAFFLQSCAWHSPIPHSQCSSVPVSFTTAVNIRALGREDQV